MGFFSWELLRLTPKKNSGDSASSHVHVSLARRLTAFSPCAGGLGSVRFTGFLLADSTAVHTFAASIDDGARVWVDGVMVRSCLLSRLGRFPPRYTEYIREF